MSERRVHRPSLTDRIGSRILGLDEQIYKELSMDDKIFVLRTKIPISYPLLLRRLKVGLLQRFPGVKHADVTAETGDSTPQS